MGVDILPDQVRSDECSVVLMASSPRTPPSREEHYSLTSCGPLDGFDEKEKESIVD